MSTARTNFVWPILVIGVGIIMLLNTADAIPDAYGDLLVRSWPVLLLMFGLNILLAGRLPYANWIVLGLSIILVVVIANLAYAERRNEYRDDYITSWQDFVPEDVSQIIVQIETKETRVTISHAPIARQILAEFKGSTISEVAMNMNIEGSVASFSVVETRSGILPKLPEVGRGTLNVWLPPGISIEELIYDGDDGSVTFDLSELTVPRTDITVRRGNMRLCLPKHSDGLTVLIGNLTLNNGDLHMIVPPNATLKLALSNPQDVTYNPPALANTDYIPLATGSLETRNVESEAFNILLDMVVDGAFTLDHISTCQ